MVEGLPQNLKSARRRPKNTSAMEGSKADVSARRPEEVHCEGVVSRWIEDNSTSNNLEEIT